MKKVISILLVLLLAVSALAAMAEIISWTCPNCGVKNDGNFCMECGTKRPEGITCPGCGTIYPADTPNSYCMECGTKLRSDDESEPLTVDPEAGRFATPADAAQRYLDGLQERDLDKMLSATDWETLESHRTLDRVAARMKGYNITLSPSFPRDGGMLSAMNIEQMKSGTATLIRRALLHFIATGPDGDNTLKSAAAGNYINVDPEEIDDFIAQFDVSRMDSLANITDVQFVLPEVITNKYALDANQRNLEKTRLLYGADEVCDLCVIFAIDGKDYVFCPGFARYGDVWTMYSPGGVLAVILGIGIDQQAFASVDELP